MTSVQLTLQFVKKSLTTVKLITKFINLSCQLLLKYVKLALTLVKIKI